MITKPPPTPNPVPNAGIGNPRVFVAPASGFADPTRPTLGEFQAMMEVTGAVVNAGDFVTVYKEEDNVSTIFTSSNGFKFDRFGAIFAAPGPHDGEQARAARLEWAQEALKEEAMSKPPTVNEFAKFLRSHDVGMSGRTGELDMVEGVPLIALHHIFMKLLEKQNAPTPKLPTEPGVYVDKDGDSWYLAADGELYIIADERWSDTDNTPEGLRDYCPFTPIEEHIEGLKK